MTPQENIEAAAAYLRDAASQLSYDPTLQERINRFLSDLEEDLLAEDPTDYGISNSRARWRIVREAGLKMEEILATMTPGEDLRPSFIGGPERAFTGFFGE